MDDGATRLTGPGSMGRSTPDAMSLEERFDSFIACLTALEKRDQNLLLDDGHTLRCDPHELASVLSLYSMSGRALTVAARLVWFVEPAQLDCVAPGAPAGAVWRDWWEGATAQAGRSAEYTVTRHPRVGDHLIACSIDQIGPEATAPGAWKSGIVTELRVVHRHAEYHPGVIQRAVDLTVRCLDERDVLIRDCYRWGRALWRADAAHYRALTTPDFSACQRDAGDA